MIRLAASKAREEFANTLDRVAHRGERVVLHRRGKEVAALVPMADLELIRRIEDKLDNEAANKALKEPGTIPWEKLKADLGLE